MSDASVIVDTGPLVAYLVATDTQHAWTVDRFRELNPPFITCEPVLTEAFYLAWRVPHGARFFFDLLATGVIKVAFDLLSERDLVRKLIAKYENVPMSLADACLVRMSEKYQDLPIFTLDSHFKIYRKHGRKQIPLITP